MSTSPTEQLPTPDFSNISRLIVVSNRLPITITKKGDGKYDFKMSSGGLVSALSGCKGALDFTWIGWVGQNIPEKDRELVETRLQEEYSCQAVYLSDELADRHYNGFSNSILWPLFHYHPGEMNFDQANWEAYREANLRFAETIYSQLQDGDTVWVQDYHLMLLPMLLRGMIDGSNMGEFGRKEVAELRQGIQSQAVSRKPPKNIKLGFFLHTPFPSSEIYR